ncbi:MAG: aryl-sulfate sulfotransferase [Melioribacteraceae bacterium]|nr:aryl-sulfate sulfotransferase [Melioribacteraceae bacterium]MCF8412738.1 aryl-sulfate sulfotransferase [Melioribacteraceae bacterium]MCF8431797.1 aryl-sulfate sulfotransferase [Melioribacteraceae bacterium]
MSKTKLNLLIILFSGVLFSQEIRFVNNVAVPKDFPELDISISTENASQDKILLASRGKNSYLLIFENDGTPYFYQKLDYVPFDFALQPNGLFTVAAATQSFAIDSTFTRVKDFQIPNDYSTDPHELLMTADGHSILLAITRSQYDMRIAIEGGNANATVQDNIVYELDENDNVIFEWNTIDNYKPGDAIHENLLNSYIDYAHINSIAIDYDGHFIISSRHQSEITKVNRQTGEIIWRFGGQNSDFTLFNETEWFSYQHDVRPVKDKPNYYTLFDNGNHNSLKYSRVIEFYLDTLNMRAEKIWEYIPEFDTKVPFMGSTRRLESGNTLIDWSDPRLPQIMEVDRYGRIFFEARFKIPLDSYRAHRIKFNGVADAPHLVVEPNSTNVNFIYNKFGDKNVEKYIIYFGFEEDSMNPWDTTSLPYTSINGLENYRRYFAKVKTIDSLGAESDFSNIVSFRTNFNIPGTNLVKNGNFEEELTFWTHSFENSATGEVLVNQDSELLISISNSGTDYEDVAISQNNLPLLQGKRYIFTFDAYSTENRILEAVVVSEDAQPVNYGKIGLTALSKNKKQISYEFIMESEDDLNSVIKFNCGGSLGDIFIDNISLKEDIQTNLEKEIAEPSEITLLQNYPNPFNPITIISFTLPHRSDISLRVYDSLGKEIAVLIDENKNAGIHSINFNASFLSSGVYFYQLQSEDFISVKKMLLIK